MGTAAERREELKAVWQQAQACTNCPQLASTRQTVVFGSGNADADLMFVGEAPGANEDRQGLPFVGQAGRLLDTLLEEIGLTRGDVFIANVLKCRPPGNRDPLPQEIDACQDYLFRQLELIEPRVVCTLGNFSTKLLRGDPSTGITRLHGREEIRRIGPRRVRLYPIYHPAAALYTPKMLDTLRADFARLPELLALEPPDQPEPEPELVVPEPEIVLEVEREPRGGSARALLSRPLVGGDRVALVVAPLAADQQVARGEALEPEAGAAGERDRRLVAGLDVGLQPVQGERPEGVVEHLLHRLAHQPLARVALVRVVAEVGGLEGAADDLRDREHAGDLALVLGQAGDEAGEVVAPRAGEEVVELVGALRRVGPRPVQLAALAGEREERLAVGPLEHPQAHPRALRRRLGIDLPRAQRGAGDRGQRAAAEHRASHTGNQSAP